MMDALIAVCESMTWRYTYTGEIQAPRGAEHPSLCPFELYDAADGQVAIAAPGERHWQLLCETIGRPEMFADPRYSSARRRVEHRDEVRDGDHRVDRRAHAGRDRRAPRRPGARAAR